MILNEFVISNKDNQDNIKDLNEKVFNLLRTKGSLTYKEIADELNLVNGSREILVDVLFKLVAMGKLKQERITVQTPTGINLTSRFSLA